MQVAIVGAGIAGVTLASELRKRGVEIDVFEKSRGLGGRLASSRMPWGTLDIGAQYFTAKDKRFKHQIKEWLDRGVIAPWDFTPYAFQNGTLRPSPDEETRYVALPTMNKLAHILAEGTTIHLSSRVTGLKRLGKQWELQSESGSQSDKAYDWVIVATPAEQSQELLRNTSIEKYIPTGILLPCWSAGLVTNKITDMQIQGLFGDADVSWVSRLTAKPGERGFDSNTDAWMVHFSGSWSKDNANASSEQVIDFAREWLIKHLHCLLPGQFEVQHSKAHFWRYAKMNPGAAKPRVIADSKTGVAAIGDWLNRGRVEGAYLSALELVEGYF